MESKEITISIEDLERMLKRQKEIVVECLLSSTTGWNGKKTEPGHVESVEINMPKFISQGEGAAYPEEFKTLKKYVR